MPPSLPKVPVPTRPASAYKAPIADHPVYASLPPLGNELAADGKSYLNPPAEKRAESYERFEAPLDNGRRGGFDVHIYYDNKDKAETEFARQLWERIRREFPELRIYKFWPGPIGPHPIAMFEVNLLNPSEFGAFVPWLVVNRGPLSALIHPNTLGPDAAAAANGKKELQGGEDPDEGLRELRNHTERAMWLGERVDLDTAIFYKMSEMQKKREVEARGA